MNKKMRIIEGVLFLVITILVISCSTRRQQYVQEIKNLQSKPILLPTKGLVIQQGKKVKEGPLNEYERLNLVIYADSLECTTCALNHIDSWQSVIEYAKHYNNQLNLSFIFSSMKNKQYAIELFLTHKMFDCPILLDTLGEFEKLNPHLPKNRALHTFLLDENNNVILVGNPLRNKKIEEMFYQIVEEKLGKPE